MKTGTKSTFSFRAADTSATPLATCNGGVGVLFVAVSGYFSLIDAVFAPAAVALREDVGRHNALDKLAGSLARSAVDAERGMVLLTSRISVEMVQKTASIGASVMVSVSAPTALAVKMAAAANITLAAIARSDGFEVFTHPHRILPRGAVHVVA